MPYMSGGSLKDMLKVRHVLPPTEAIHLTTETLNALQYAHERGLIHRDIKPGNMLFKSDGKLMLCDFGLVKVISPETQDKYVNRLRFDKVFTLDTGHSPFVSQPHLLGKQIILVNEIIN